MPFHAKSALFLLLLYPDAVHPGLAQDKRASSNRTDLAQRGAAAQQNIAVHRLLTLNEGLAILSAALDSRHNPADFSADCSHFVHELYERAGFLYEYASSSDLYEGTDEFRQVASPQPGDLAVWPGHAGIVVNPDQHSFFSVLHAGPGVDSYDSPYWKQRGRPRFFRYLKPAHGSVAPTSIRPANLNDTEPYESDPDGRVQGISGVQSSQPSSSAKLGQNQPANSETSRFVTLSAARPKSDQVSAAFLEACNDSEALLRGRGLFKSAQSLVVFDQFEVKKVHISGNQGWIEVQIDELVSLAAGEAEVLHKGLVRQRWVLRRDDRKIWKLTPSRNAIYLPQRAAERLLAHQLAQLTEDASDNASGTQEKATLARLLDVLFGK
jgi:NlpC/P60 family